MKTRAAGLLALTLTIPLALSACGSEDEGSGQTSQSAAGASAQGGDKPMATSEKPAMEKAGRPFGPGCASVPKSGKGSFAGMSQDPVATAASNNPALSTLVKAVGAAGLADTLNTTENITVFAPTNDAFAKIPKADLDKLLKDKPALTKVLTGHVVKPRLSPSKVSGTHNSLAKTKVKVTGSGKSFTVDGKAKVVCGNVQTKNATVYLIDTVLMPE